jgi:hypothetical protein
MSRIKQARDKLYRKVYEHTYSMDSLINPSDIEKHAGSWEEVDDEKLDEELRHSVDISMTEGQFEEDIRHLAVIEWLQDMPRVSMDHLTFDTHDKALYEGYWPYRLSHQDAVLRLKEHIYHGEVHIGTSAQNKAREIATKALADKYDPRIEEPRR